MDNQRPPPNSLNPNELMEVSPEESEDITMNNENYPTFNKYQPDNVMELENYLSNNEPYSEEEAELHVIIDRCRIVEKKNQICLQKMRMKEEKLRLKNGNGNDNDMLCAIYYHISIILGVIKNEENTIESCYRFETVSSSIRAVAKCWMFLKEIAGTNNVQLELPLEHLMGLNLRNCMKKIVGFWMCFEQLEISEPFLDEVVMEEEEFVEYFLVSRDSYSQM